MPKRTRSLAAIDARMRELEVARAALEQELDKELGRAVRRTLAHAPATVTAAVRDLLVPYARSDADRRVLGGMEPLVESPADAAYVPTLPHAPTPPDDTELTTRSERRSSARHGVPNGAPSAGHVVRSDPGSQLTLA